jgi:hypothetical protein
MDGGGVMVWPDSDRDPFETVAERRSLSGRCREQQRRGECGKRARAKKAHAARLNKKRRSANRIV